jgi:hypothetical protein
MTPAVEQLVRETVELTGAEEPELLEDDAPVLADEALAATGGEGDGDDGGFYLVGLIGGKEVGKSALVNALAGRSVTAITSHGPGTETAVAYAHASREPALRALLEREVPGQYRIVTHDIAALRNQVLVDLPDIDSHWQSHPVVTRAMLRHMLYPLWIVSVEKYADRQPQEMLRKVAAGNAPENFVFCLNKVDQAPGTPASSTRQRRSATITPTAWVKMLGLPHPPAVFMISAIHPEGYDLPRLRQMLSRQKSGRLGAGVEAAAVRRQDRTLLAWLDGQALPQRVERLARLRRRRKS